MKIIVTGGAGFIGSHLVDKLIAEGNKVLVIDDLSGGSKENLNPKAEFYQSDCRDEYAMNFIMGDFLPEVVYHLAANAAENKSHFSPIEVTSRNYDAFIKVITPFIRYGGRRFVFTSSIAAYGALQTPFKETDRPEPEDLYGISKYACEQSLKVLSKIHNFEYVITRPHNVYGPRQNMRDPYRNVVTIWMNSLLRKKPYTIYGDGSMQRCFSYIDDVVNSIYNCGFLNVNGKTFNVGSDASYTLSELSTALQEVTGVKIMPKYLPIRPNEVPTAISDHELAKKFLSYKDTISLKKGLKKTWTWAKSMGPQEPIFTKLEIETKDVPKNWL